MVPVKIFGIRIGGVRKRRSPANTGQRRQTTRQAKNSLALAKMEMQAAGIEAFKQYLDSDPETALAIGRQALGIKQESLKDQLIAQELKRNPAFRQEYLKKYLAEESIELGGGGDWMRNMERTIAFMDRLGLSGKKSGFQFPELPPEAATILSVAVSKLVDKWVGGDDDGGNKKRLSAARSNGHRRAEEANDTVEGEVEEVAVLVSPEVDECLDHLMTLVRDREDPQQTAEWVVGNLNDIGRAYLRDGKDVEPLQKVWEVLSQGPTILYLMLKGFVGMSRRSAWVKVVEGLNSKEGQEWLAAFCEARDRVVEEKQGQQQAAEGEEEVKGKPEVYI